MVNLYEVSGLSLGDTIDHKLQAVKHLRTLSRARFQSACSEILSSRAPDATLPILEIGQTILNTTPDDNLSLND